MGSHISFEYLKHKLWPKQRPEVKLPIWLPTIKSQEWPWFTYVQVACHISLKSSQQGLQLCFKHHLNRRLKRNFMSFQSCKSPNFGNFRTPYLRVPGPNDIWLQAPWLGIENTIRGDVLVSLNYRPWWVLWVHVCLWFVRAPKVLQLCINQLVV